MRRPLPSTASEQETTPETGESDLARLVFWLSGMLLVFGYGVAVGAYHVFPYGLLHFGKDAVVQLWAEKEVLVLRQPAIHLHPARYDGSGVTRFEPEQAAPGFTLITSFFDGALALRLIRLDGSVVRSWPVSYSEILPNTAHVLPRSKIPQSDWHFEIHGAVALPDGAVVFNIDNQAMVKLDRCGNHQWTVPSMTHHAIDLSEDGYYWVPSRRFVADTSEIPLLRAPYDEDTLLKVSADGQVVTEISIPRLLFGVDLLRALFGHRFPATGEIVHSNDVEELSRGMADHFPLFVAGDLMVSLRNLNLILVVDPMTWEVKWHQTGPWIGQHDPDFRPDGTISVFNNNADRTEDGSILGGSNIMTIDPVTEEVAVVYGAEPDQRMFTHHRGMHQYVGSDGRNILITEAEAGRLLEVNSAGELVWEYINRYDEDQVLTITGAIRYPEHYFTVDDWSCDDEDETGN